MSNIEAVHALLSVGVCITTTRSKCSCNGFPAIRYNNKSTITVCWNQQCYQKVRKDKEFNYVFGNRVNDKPYNSAWFVWDKSYKVVNVLERREPNKLSFFALANTFYLYVNVKYRCDNSGTLCELNSY